MSAGKYASSSRTLATFVRNATSRSSTGLSNTRSVPPDGSSSPITARRTVDFPEPLAPTRATTLPGASVNVTGAHTGAPP